MEIQFDKTNTKIFKQGQERLSLKNWTNSTFFNSVTETRQWNCTFKRLRENNHQLLILYSAIVSITRLLYTWLTP